MNNLPDMDQVIINMLEGAKERTIAKTAQYRLFLKLKDKEVVYDDPVIVAALLSKGFKGIPDDVSEETLDKIVELSVALFSETYDTLLKDLNNDKALANRVFKELVRNQ